MTQPSNGFGLAFPKCEGAPIHPDDPMFCPSSKEVYDKQMKLWSDWYDTTQ